MGVTASPFHPRCRSVEAPFFDDEYSDLFNDGAVRAARNPETGKTEYVPADMTYKEWKKRFVDNDKFTSESNGGIIKSKTGFRTFDDPMREVMGAAEKSNPNELANIMFDLESNGVIVKYREGTMGYFPPAEPGKPGDIVMEKGASFSAWSHEYKHFCDDRNDGYLGIRVLADPKKCAQREIDAYQVEIDLANKLPENVRDEMVKRLESLRDNEVKRYD